MCMTCGCGEPAKRHHPTDITTEDLQRAADGAGVSFGEAARNLRRSSEDVAKRPTHHLGVAVGGQATR